MRGDMSKHSYPPLLTTGVANHPTIGSEVNIQGLGKAD